jgi:multicomponent Na+:H+ antiporter subunit B
MDSLILRTASRVIMPLQLAFSLVLLLRGHNEPGGGFIGGLVAACGIALYGIAHGIPEARRFLRLQPQTLIALGLLCAVVSGLAAMFAGLPFLTGLWGGSVPTLVVGQLKFGTPLLFDTGVYLVVAGVAMLMVFTLAEDR